MSEHLKHKEIIENYYNYLNAQVETYERALKNDGLPEKVIEQLNQGIAGVKTELKWVTFRLDSVNKHLAKPAEPEMLPPTESIN